MKFEEIIKLLASLVSMTAKANGINISMTSFADGEINVLCCDKNGDKAYELYKSADSEWTEKNYNSYLMKKFNGGV